VEQGVPGGRELRLTLALALWNRASPPGTSCG